MRSRKRTTRLGCSLRAALAGSVIALAPLATAGAADLTPGVIVDDSIQPPVLTLCEVPVGPVILFDRYGRPTVPARTPMYYCLTGHTLTPGEVPPPPEYCCR